MRKLLFIFIGLFAFQGVFAQIDTTIRGVQFRPQDSLAVGSDANNFNGQRVRLKGVVIIPGTANVSSSEANPNRQVWMRQIGGGPFSTISFRQSGNTAPTDMRDLQVGDTVQVTGTAAEFQGESQLGPISEVRVLSLYEPGSPKPQATPTTVGQFNNAQQQNIITTGEQFEGDYVEVRNVRVIAVDRFFASNASRVSFTVQDAQGNKMNIGDRFFAQRLPNCSTSPVNLCGKFIPPSVGDEFRALRGIVLHSKNVRGYEIHPFDSADYEKGKSAPYVININNNPYKPTSNQTCLITAQITDGTDSLGRRASITSVMLFYTRLASTATSVTTYTDSLPMARVGASDLFNATIPAQADGSIVAYYIRVRNNQGLTTNAPDLFRSALAESPRFYWVFDRDLRIADIQYNPLTLSRSDIANNLSGGNGAQVTVSGIVTADTSMSGRVFFMQDPMSFGRDFAGIMVRVANESDLRNLRKGQTVTVTGIIGEDIQMTYINASNVVISPAPLQAVLPLEIPFTELTVGAPSVTGVTNWNLIKEKYEGQLIRIVNPAGNLVVSTTNFLSSTNTNPLANFGEWKVSGDALASSGAIVLSGFRSSSSTYVSSYYNPFINIDTASRLRVTPTPITAGQNFVAITGVAYHSFGSIKLIPRDGNDVWTTPQGVEGTNNNVVSIFPNPATYSVNIKVNAENTSGYTAFFTDLSGRVVKQTSVNNAESISVNGLRSGLYIVSVTDATGKMVYRNKLNIVK